MGTWTVGLLLASSLALGSGAGHHALPGSLDDGLGLPDEPVESLDLGPLDEVTSPVDEGLSSTMSIVEPLIEPVIEPIEEIVEPVVDPLIDEVLEPVVEVPVDPDPLPDEGGDPLPPPQPPEDAVGADPDPGASTVLPTDPAAPEPTPGFEPAAAPGAARLGVGSGDERLLPLLEAARFRSPVVLPVEPGSTLEGILAWLSSGPAIVRVLAAPMELLWVLIRALISAGSGLVAPFSLLVALVVRQVREARRSSVVG